MKPNASQIVFLVVGLVVGYALCALSYQMRGEAPNPTPVAAPQESPTAEKPMTSTSPPKLAPPKRPTRDTVTTAPGDRRLAQAPTEEPERDANAPGPEIEKAETPAGAAPRIWVETTSCDTGIVPNNEKTVKEIQVANKGKAPLLIKNVRTTCGCVSAKITDTTVAPDSATTLAITIDPYKIHGFTSKKTITIASNDPENSQLKIDVTTQIKPEFAVEPENLEFGEVEKGVVAEASLLFRQLSDEPVEVVDVKPWGGADGMVLAVEEIPSDQWAKPGHREYRIKAKLLPELSPGPFTGRFKIQTTCKRMPSVSCLAKATIRAFYSISPQTVVLQNQTVLRTQAGKSPRSIEISADRLFEVTDVAPSDEDIAAAVRPGDTPNTTFIDLELKPDAKPGTWNRSVSFNVKSGEQTYRERIPVRVLVRKMTLDSPASSTKSLMQGREGTNRVPNVAAPSGEKPAMQPPSPPVPRPVAADAKEP